MLHFPFSASVSLSLKRALAGVQLALGNPHEKTGRQASWAEADASRKEGPKTLCLHDAGALTAPQAALGGRGAAGALIMSDRPQILVHCFRKLSPLLKHLVMGFSAERSRGLLESRLRLRLAGRGLCWSTSFQNVPKSRWTTSNGKTPTSYPFSGSCLFFHLCHALCPILPFPCLLPFPPRLFLSLSLSAARVSRHPGGRPGFASLREKQSPVPGSEQ